MGGIGIWQLLIVLGIVLLIFGTKKLRNLGGDVGGAIKNFKGAVKEDGKEDDGSADKQVENKEGNILEGEAKKEENDKV